MIDRRQLVRTIAAGVGGVLSGCATERYTRDSPDGQSNPDGPSGGDDRPDGDISTPGEPEATPQPNKNEVNVSLPGDPARIQNGQLPMYGVEEITKSRSEGLSSGVGSGSKGISAGSTGTTMYFHPKHDGSGRASGYATGTYRTAWTAPETGQYQLRAMFNRQGEFLYNLPPNGQVMTSFDINAQIINYDRSSVVANQKFPQSLHSSSPRASAEFGEFLIETAITAVLGYALGLGLVARVVLSQIVDELVELDDPGRSGRRYDVAAGVQWAQSPINIGGPFNVTKGTTVIFEISPMLSWSYEMTELQMAPRFDANFDFHGFWVERLD